jgi:hypothetical protein
MLPLQVEWNKDRLSMPKRPKVEPIRQPAWFETDKPERILSILYKTEQPVLVTSSKMAGGTARRNDILCLEHGWAGQAVPFITPSKRQHYRGCHDNKRRSKRVATRLQESH